MKKRFITMLLMLCLALSLCTAALADEAGLFNVTDDAGVLSDEEYAELETTAESISAQYGCGVYIILLDNYYDYYVGSAVDCAKSLYTDYSLGVGEAKDGVLLMMSFSERDFALIAYGDFGNRTFTDYGKEVVEESFLDNFHNDDWYGGLSDYLTSCDELLYASSNGSAVDVDSDEGSSDYGSSDYGDADSGSPGIVVFFLISAVIALIVCFILKAGMKSVKTASAASAYISPGSIELREKSDVFTHTTQTRVKVETESSGGTTVDSDGFSGDSGKF